MTEKTLLEEHNEEFASLLLEEEKDKESTLTDDEKLEREILAEGLEEEEEVLDDKETDDEKLEKEILEEDDLEQILEEDVLFEKRIRESRLNNFLMNQSYDASLSDTGIQPIMNLEEELEEIPLEENKEEQDFSYKRLGDSDEDAYTKVVVKYESGNRDPSGPPQLRNTAERILEEQGKLYKTDTSKKDDPHSKFIEFKQPKEAGYDNNMTSKAKRGIY